MEVIILIAFSIFEIISFLIALFIKLFLILKIEQHLFYLMNRVN